MESKFNGSRATSPVGTQLLIALFMLTSHGLASAQPVDEDADVDDALEEVVVTGTRIRRTADFDLPVPVQSLSARDLEVSGVNQLGEAIIELPSVTAALTSETSQSSTQSSGQSTISLRNLGSSRTLTLIDGRRTVGNTSTGSTISLDTIPDTFVERIEVITGGTTAVYGSDAVTGVVNIITRDDFEGFSIGNYVAKSASRQFKPIPCYFRRVNL